MANKSTKKRPPVPVITKNQLRLLEITEKSKQIMAYYEHIIYGHWINSYVVGLEGI